MRWIKTQNVVMCRQQLRILPSLIWVAPEISIVVSPYIHPWMYPLINTGERDFQRVEEYRTMCRLIIMEVNLHKRAIFSSSSFDLSNFRHSAQAAFLHLYEVPPPRGFRSPPSPMLNSLFSSNYYLYNDLTYWAPAPNP